MPKYIEAYTTKQDLHKRTAAAMFNVPVNQVTKQQRDVLNINFGLIMGWGKGLKEKLKLNTGKDYTEDEVAKFIKDFKNCILGH